MKRSEPPQAGIDDARRKRVSQPEPRIYNTRFQARRAQQQVHHTPPTDAETPCEQTDADLPAQPAPSLSPGSEYCVLRLPEARPSPAPLASPITYALPSSNSPMLPAPSPFNFSLLPPELRANIVSCLVDHWRHGKEASPLAPYAAVSREFQAVVETYTFSSLCVSLSRLEDFTKNVQSSRRRCVRKLCVHVELPDYANDPCKSRESIRDKQINNHKFTETFCRLFSTMSNWSDNEVATGGISLVFSVSSPSDLRNAPFDLWQKRRWNPDDIGEKRFQDSYIDFVGQDEESRRTDLLPPVHAITSFTSSDLNRRAVMPAAYADIIAKLPHVKAVTLDLMKDRRVHCRKTIFDQVAGLLMRWPSSIESLDISGNTISSWRELPHEQNAEKDSGKQLGAALRQFSSQLKHLNIKNLVKIREFLRPVWPTLPEDRWPFMAAKCPDLPIYHNLETINLAYGTVYYDIDWRSNSTTGDASEDAELLDFRQSLSLAAARLAYHMPRLRLMTVSQRPLMWAGKHRLEYRVGPPQQKAAGAQTVTPAPPGWRTDVKGKGPEEIATVSWTSTFTFKPWDRTIEAWTEVARAQDLELKVEVNTENGWQTDGFPPSGLGSSF